MKTRPPSRREQYKAVKGRPPTLPVVIFGSHLVDALFECGPTMEGQPISFREIESWSSLMRRTLDPWEASTLRLMSQAYAGQAQRSREPDCPSPLEEGKETPDRSKPKGSKITEKFRALSRSRSRGRRG